MPVRVVTCFRRFESRWRLSRFRQEITNLEAGSLGRRGRFGIVFDADKRASVNRLRHCGTLCVRYVRCRADQIGWGERGSYCRHRRQNRCPSYPAKLCSPAASTMPLPLPSACRADAARGTEILIPEPVVQLIDRAAAIEIAGSAGAAYGRQRDLPVIPPNRIVHHVDDAVAVTVGLQTRCRWWRRNSASRTRSPDDRPCRCD